MSIRPLRTRTSQQPNDPHSETAFAVMEHRPMIAQSPRAVRARRRHTDRGFTLIELVVAIVLSSMIAGVVVAALITSLHVARSTTDSVGDSADTGLISTFLIRDAQSSGGIDPTTGRPNPSLGISADPSAPDWAGCTQYIPGVFLPDGSPKPASFIVRFSWLDAASASAVVATYALVPDPIDSTKPQLIRRLCKNGVAVDLVLGRHLTSAVISCLTGTQPNTTCAGQPTSVSLSVNGSSISVNGAGVPLPYSATLSASFRSAASQLTISGPTALPPGQVGVAYQTMAIAPTASPNLITAGSNAPATWVATGLPGGLTISSSTGTISGTPTVAGGPFTVVITATDAAATSTTTYSTSASKTYSITISAALSASGPASLPVGQSGVLYTSTQMTRTGGTAPYTWTQSGLPAGLSISADGSGAITGTPTVSGSFPVTVTVTDAMTGTNTKSYVVTINAVLAISTVSLPNGQVGVGYSTTVASTGGTAPKTWTASGLPSGLTFNTSTATISGTPTAAGTFTVIVTVNDAMTGTATKTYTVVINAVLSVATASLPNGQVGVAYSSTVAPSGGTAPYAWSATGLPTGLTINAAGLVSGTPTVAGIFNPIVTVTDAIPTTATKTYAITIAVAAVTCPGAVVGWKGEYFPNVTLAGLPVLCRDDANPISLDWGSGSPDPTVPVDNFSVRWTRTQTFAAGYYTFTMGSDDGSRLYIDGGAAVIDSWGDRAYATSPPYSVFVADGVHTIVMEFYERGGSARATLNWVASNPPACSVSATGWLGQYYSNATLTGLPAACRDDADPLNFNWGIAAPYPGLPVDNFSVRWTKTPTFTAGTYKFSLGTDDGGRLYIDGVIALDQSVVHAYPTPQPSVTKTLTAGPHVIVVEYFDQTGTAQATLVVAAVPPPSIPVLTFSAFTNTYWSGAGSTLVFYRPAAASGSFTTTASSTDVVSGVASYAFPAPLGTNWISTAGALGVNTYSWTVTPPAVPGVKNVTATNNAGLTSGNSPFTPTADSTAPTAGTVTYPNATQAATTVSVNFVTGTDPASGIGTRLLQRQSATLTGITCGAYGAFATVANGTNPTSPVVDTVALGNCYQYQYVVSDNVGNSTTAAGASVLKVRNSYFETVNTTAGLLNYWRLGEPSATVSSDTFTGTSGATLQSHTGEIGATWAKHAISATDAVITPNGRIRKSGNTSGALYYSSAVPTSADYTVEADVFVASILNNDQIGLVGRLDPTGNGTFYATYYDESTQKWSLVRVINGAPTVIQTQASGAALTANTTYRVGLSMTGSTIRLLINGVQLLSGTDTTITAAGRGGFVVGFGTQNTNDTDNKGMQLDNYSVTLTNVPIVDNKGVNTGTYVNAPTLGVAGALTVSGDPDTAVQFDGISDYGTVARQISTDFSIEFWFKSSAGGIGTGVNWWEGAGLVDAEVGGGMNDFGVSLRSDGRVVAGVGSGSDVSIVSTPATSYKNGNWHHVVFTRTMASGVLQLYIDGASAGSATGGTGTLNGPSFINFGRLQSGGNYFAGSLDEIAIYTTVLTQATVTAHYNAA